MDRDGVGRGNFFKKMTEYLIFGQKLPKFLTLQTLHFLKNLKKFRELLKNYNFLVPGRG